MSMMNSKRVQDFILKTSNPIGEVEFNGHKFSFAGILSRRAIMIADGERVLSSRLYYYKRTGELGVRMSLVGNYFGMRSKQFNFNEFADSWIHYAISNAIYYAEKYPRGTFRQLMDLEIIDSSENAGRMATVSPFAGTCNWFDEELCNMFNAECYIAECERRFRDV